MKKYVNVEADDWPLFIGWLTAAVRPVGPHPILVLTGEQGAAKTTMLRLCRRLIDPNASPVRSQPKELRDLMIAARKSWLLAYDNISALPGWLSNGFCGLSTGTGFSIRSLGTDDDETIFVAQGRSSSMESAISWTRPTWEIGRTSCTCRGYPGRCAELRRLFGRNLIAIVH